MNGSKLMVLCMGAALALTACPPPKGGADGGTADKGPVACNCGSACGAGQRCNTNQCPAYCEEICNAPDGCKADIQSCNEATATCENAKCGGTTCQDGQGCFDPTVAGSGTPAGSTLCTCMPAYVDASGSEHKDTCADLGMVCDMDTDNPAASTCRKPGEFEDCLPSVGCVDNTMDCKQISSYQLCLKKCGPNNGNALCPDTSTFCVTGTTSAINDHCWFNLCASDSSGNDVMSEYFKPCDASASGAQDGTCAPFRYSDYSLLGLCLQNGTAATGGKCDPDGKRTDTGFAAHACGANNLCMFNQQPDSAMASGKGGTCMPLCNAAPSPDATANPACPGTAGNAAVKCVDVTGAPSGKMPTMRMGACMETCKVVGTGSNVNCLNTPDAYGNTMGCVFNLLDFSKANNGLCWPLNPSAGAVGAACATLGAGDNRWDCADRLYCNTDKNCHKHCDLTTCNNPANACADCSPATEKCESDTSVVGLGFCIQ